MVFFGLAYKFRGVLASWFCLCGCCCLLTFVLCLNVGVVIMLWVFGHVILRLFYVEILGSVDFVVDLVGYVVRFNAFGDYFVLGVFEQVAGSLSFGCFSFGVVIVRCCFCAFLLRMCRQLC